MSAWIIISFTLPQAIHRSLLDRWDDGIFDPEVELVLDAPLPHN